MLMDSSKIDKSLPYTFANFSDIDILITNTSLPDDLAKMAAEKNVNVIDVTYDN